MVHMEEELGEALPYWDWTEDGTVPSLWEDIQAPIVDPIVGSCSGNGFTSPEPTAQVDSKDLRILVRNALREETFHNFSREFELPHNNLHISMVCDMETLETAAYAPLFYLHHTYIRGLRVCLLAGTPTSSRS